MRNAIEKWVGACSHQGKTKQHTTLADGSRMMQIYRYISLLFISSFFFLYSDATLATKCLVVASLSVSSIVLNILYPAAGGNKHMIRCLVAMETVGNIVMLIPTGGLQSPYIWYALNTVLITLKWFSFRYCALVLTLYIVFSTWLSQMIFYKSEIHWIHSILQNSNTILGLVLVTLVTNLLVKAENALEKEKNQLLCTNKELSALNKGLKNSVEHIMALYRTIDTLSNENDKKKITRLLLLYLCYVMKRECAFYCAPQEDAQWSLELEGISGLKDEDNIITAVMVVRESILRGDKSMNILVDGVPFTVTSLKSSYGFYGIVGVKSEKAYTDLPMAESMDQLQCLAGIGAMALDRARLEGISRKLVISQEQNRIADEIHDSVNQRLFAASCSIQTLLRKFGGSMAPEERSELQLVRESVGRAITELREVIYGMSWKKWGKNIFCDQVKAYILDISQLYGVEADLNITGNQEWLSHDMKNILYRMICEGAGNAMKHSHCSRVMIIMDIGRNTVSLVIRDNGTGFDIGADTGVRQKGLGLGNIQSLVQLHQGQCFIESQPNIGTSLRIILPNSMNDKENVV